jgi:hypothetical protein
MLTKRSNAFREYGLQGELSDVRISNDNKLCVGNEGSGYGFVLFKNEIMLARGR